MTAKTKQNAAGHGAAEVLNTQSELVAVGELRSHPRNPRQGDIGAIHQSIEANGFFGAIVAQRSTGHILAGNHRWMAAKAAGITEVPVMWVDVDDDHALRILLADNRVNDLASYDEHALAELLQEVLDTAGNLEGTGYDEDALDELLADLQEPLDLGADKKEYQKEDGKAGSLQARFGVPPFSVLDARQGYWLERKRTWLAKGITSEEGRAEDMLSLAAAEQRLGMGGVNGTSIFDPVLAELGYRWFSPEGGTVLDPFAGGSVRGIVAALTGRQYVGCDLRPEQVEANRRQWDAISTTATAVVELPARPDYTPEYTPVEALPTGQWVKRDDLYTIAGISGGKVRSCWHLAQGAPGLVTAGSRQSPQVNIVAQIAKRLGIPCRVHVPTGDLTPELEAAKAAGAEVFQHKPGHNSVIVARAREDAKATGYTEIPFGMECWAAVEQTRLQVGNLPEGVRRIVMPVGSGMSLAGVLHGLRDHGLDVPVLGVQVGADPTKRLEEYAPEGWRQMVELVKSPLDYHEHAPSTLYHGIALDPIYEAKCLPYLQEGDLLWVVGIRQTELEKHSPVKTAEECPHPVWVVGDSQDIERLAEGTQADLIFSCPPYADLEVYSENPLDLSTMDYPAFLQAYRAIIAASVRMLKQDRFACFVVGEVRDKRGNYYNFVGDTIQAFIDAGCSYYNEAILVTPTGSLPIRAGKAFASGRKLGKTHQNVLVFVKGDWKKAAEACGQVEFSLPDADVGTESHEEVPDAL